MRCVDLSRRCRRCTAAERWSCVSHFRDGQEELSQAWDIGSARAAQPSRPLAEVIIALGHTLGLRVVAEGVETQEQLDWLRQTDCDEYQGFLYSAAVPADAFEALVKGSR